MPEPLDPRTSDYLRERSASGYRGAAATNRTLARALGVHEPDSSRLRTGNPGKRDTAHQFFQILWRLGVNYPRTNPHAFIVEAQIIARQALMRAVDTEPLRNRYTTLLEHEAQAAAEVSRLVRTQADPLKIADAMRVQAVCLEDMAAVLRELAGRDGE